jgi:hypothetical protein
MVGNIFPNGLAAGGQQLFSPRVPLCSIMHLWNDNIFTAVGSISELNIEVAIRPLLVERRRPSDTPT